MPRGNVSPPRGTRQDGERSYEGFPHLVEGWTSLGWRKTCAGRRRNIVSRVLDATVTLQEAGGREIKKQEWDERVWVNKAAWEGDPKLQIFPSTSSQVAAKRKKVKTYGRVQNNNSNKTGFLNCLN